MAATPLPASMDAPVGRASHSTSAPNAKPSGTRLRASAPARRVHVVCELCPGPAPPPRPGSAWSPRSIAVPRLSLLTTPGRQPTLDGRQHLGDFDVEQAHPFALAPAQMM